MNKYIIILIIILILFMLISIIKKNNEHYSAESLINIFSPCREYDNSTATFNSVNITDILRLGSGQNVKTLKDYILDRLYPIGSFYVQYPDKNSNYDSDAFPVSKSPGKLFGGDWQEQWPDESIFFRTRGPEAKENRVKGFQGDALKMFVGKTALMQSNRWIPGYGNNGIFGGGIHLEAIGTDAGDSSDIGHVNYFDSAYQSNMSKLETRVRNRQIKVWKRIKKLNNGGMPDLPDNGFDTQYDNIYYDGPYPNTSFVSPKDFNIFDIINTQEKAMMKCKELGESCKGIGMINGKPNVYNYSSDGVPTFNPEGDNSYRVWYKKKNTSVL